ncbi:MAG: methyltransferase domain-containing protein [Planctomycetota bacterium]
MLEHVEDPPKVLAELVRVAKAGALLMLSVPDPVAESIQRSLAPPVYWQKPNHLRIFEREEFDALIRDAGLEIQNRPGQFFYWSMYWILFWGTRSEHQFSDPDSNEPLLDHWNETWHALISNPKADHVTKALNEFMPKSQVVIARKAA